MRNIAIITGWTSSERPISLKSAETRQNYLEKLWYNVKKFIIPEDLDSLLKNINKIDLIIPIIHWIDGEDGKITALAELFKKPYFFSDYSVLNLTLNKYLTNLFVKKLNLKNIILPRSILINNYKEIDLIPKYFKDKKIILKPNKGGSSINTIVCKVDDISANENNIKEILKSDELLVQEFIPIKKELSISIFWDYDKYPKIIWITEIKYNSEIFDYEAKYLWKSEEIHYLIKEYIEVYWWNLRDKIKSDILTIYKKLKIKTLWRIDIIVGKDDNIYFLEINTIPGFSQNSIYPQIASKYWWNLKNFFVYLLKCNKLWK